MSLALLLLVPSSLSFQGWTYPSKNRSFRVRDDFDVVEDTTRNFGMFKSPMRRQAKRNGAPNSSIGYIPDGLTAEQYEEIKRKDAAKNPGLYRGNDYSTSIQSEIIETLQDYTDPSKVMARAMTATGVILSAALIYVLASSNGDILFTEPETVFGNIVEATLPVSVDDALAIAISESIGGIVASFGTNAVSMLVQKAVTALAAKEEDAIVNPSLSSGPKKSMEDGGNEKYVTRAIAESDFFIVKSASLPLLQDLMGVPAALAPLGSVLVATVPYEIIKFGAISKQRRQEEEELLNQLLEEELARKRQMQLPNFLTGKKDKTQDELSPVIPVKGIDFVSAFGDTIKWLEYDVLQTKLVGISSIYFGRDIPVAVESGIFGAMAALSAGIWADLCYAIAERDTILAGGGDDQRLAFMSRLRRYGVEAIRGAALFGVYEAIQNPLSTVIATLLPRGGSELLTFSLL